MRERKHFYNLIASLIVMGGLFAFVLLATKWSVMMKFFWHTFQ